MALSVPAAIQAQHGQTMSDADARAMAAHMEMTAKRSPNPQDSARAEKLVQQLRASITKYRDVRVAVDDGFRQFAPQIRNQPVYHFTNYRYAIENAFKFNGARPTSLLYRKDASGNFVLVGAMYTAPKRTPEDQLDKRVPLSVARWHKHINWCLPKDSAKWTRVRNGRPVFGPLGVATREECESAGGRFMPEVFGWMVHANVFESNDPHVIWGDDHRMSGDEMMEHHGR